MKRWVLVGTVAGLVIAPHVFAQAPKTGRRAAATGDQTAGTPGHTAPKPQPGTEASPSAPTGEVALGSVHLTKGVKANGQSLSAGTYQLRLTAQTAAPDAKGQTAMLERWVEFVQGGQVKGREVVTIVPQAQMDKVQKDAPPHANAAKVELLKGGAYYRVWINKGGNHYLLHLPAA
jgi:hypothetical protein